MMLAGAEIPIDTLSAGEVASAFVELFVRVTNSRSAYWGELGLVRDSLDGSGDPSNFLVTHLTVPADDAWHRIQVPLMALSLGGPQRPGEMDGDPFSVAAFPTGLNGFRFGAPFDVNASVRIDSVRIRW